MKKKFYPAAILLLALSGCTFGGNSTPVTSTGASSNEATSASAPESSASSIESSSTSKEDDLTKHPDVKETFTNAIRVPTIGGQKEAADPFVFRFNGKYYLYCTTGGAYLRGYVSEDLVSWDPVQAEGLPLGYVYSYSLDETGHHPDSQSPWAPEVTYINGHFYLITSPSGDGHYILESEKPEGPFRRLSANLGNSIDGDFFVENDGNVFVLRADSSAIVIHHLNSAMTDFENLPGVDVTDQTLLPCHIGGWNEGPFVLRRNGASYCTYTGTHFLSPGYRVDYAYAPKGAPVYKASSWTREDTVLLSTIPTYRGLGHSMTTLGPDMDSYYIVYHNIELDSTRYFNIARLSFNGSEMIANDVERNDNFVPTLPDFSLYGSEQFVDDGTSLLSDMSSSSSFTAEFNAIGEGKMFFGYKDASNYGYISPSFATKEIKIRQVSNGLDEIVAMVELPMNYTNDVLHSYRLSYRNGQMNFSFDGVEYLALQEASYQGGKIGYEKGAFSEIGYTAFSNVAIGSSDAKEYTKSRKLANAYDENLSILSSESGLVDVKDGAMKIGGSQSLSLKKEGDRATYRVFAQEDNVYSLDVRVPSSSLGKKIGIRIDGGAIKEMSLENNPARAASGDSYLRLGEINLSQGAHNLSFCHVGDDFALNEFKLSLQLGDATINEAFSTGFNSVNYYVRNNALTDANGLTIGAQHSMGAISMDDYRNATASAKLNISDFGGGFAGILLNIDGYSKNVSADADGGDNTESFRGYELLLDGENLTLRYINYNFSETLKNYSYACPLNTDVTISLRQINNVYVASINGVEAFRIVSNLGNLQGGAGFFASLASGYYKTFTLVNE